MKDEGIGASPEVARDMLIASRNRRLAHLMNDSLFESELKSFRASLVEQRQHLFLAYGRATRDDIREIILVLLNSADMFLKLLPAEGSALGERPRDAMKQKMGIVAGITLVSGEKNARRDGVHGSYVMEHNFGRQRTQEIVKGNPSIDQTAVG